MTERPIPMLGDLALEHVTAARHSIAQRLVALPVAGLAGDVQQRLGRGSHEIELEGLLVGDGARDRLGEIQTACADGQELDFTADITTALSLAKVVVVSAEFLESAGRPGRYPFRLLLRESPPLPPPAELSPFGGLPGTDLGFDTDILGDIADAAGAIQDAVEVVQSGLAALDALSAIADLGSDNPLAPVQREGGKLEGAGDPGAGAKLGEMLRG